VAPVIVSAIKTPSRPAPGAAAGVPLIFSVAVEDAVAVPMEIGPMMDEFPAPAVIVEDVSNEPTNFDAALLEL
jgi:hypothetical protein